MIDLKIFEPAILLEYTEQDRDLASQLLEMGRSDLPDFLKKAEELARKEEYLRASSCMHSFKGTAGAMGAGRLQELAFRCETLLKGGDPSASLAELFSGIAEELEKLFSDPLFLSFTNDRTLQ